ncbi:hypothetical protein [Terriglobus roseus]|uniref:Uncharacterized protein n=1 Tax=Terriglobus roseus TaxID=392734 RepID=A0A1H4JSE1_9BACT|nr:hypothetical protein [Terriglobus roseus]SEB49183.1 hypothetical protein SAMN05443244_0789 [Terriglobus roseus]
MVIQKTDRELWAPETDADHKFVWAELEGVLHSPQFSNSKRYPAFLRYVVAQTLEGHGPQIKERTIGIEVFGRPSDYDTNNDTVVRYTAGEVRKRLATYFHDHEDAALEITIPHGCYVPEFHRAIEAVPIAEADVIPTFGTVTTPPYPALTLPAAALVASSAQWRRSLPLYVLLTVIGLGLGLAMVSRRVQAARTSAVDRFWSPVLHDRGTPLLVPGVVVYSPNPYSGTETATKEAEYPFVSVQVAAATARMSGLLQKNGSSYQMQPANTTTLSELRDRSVILIGAYNNPWTRRLLQDTHYRLDVPTTPAILSSSDPQQHWQRDHTLPYAASDDYALLGRFRDKTTGSLIVVVAGLGRNGTEAAAEFLTDPQYMAELEKRLGKPIGDQNMEAVLKISVVDGKTGAPSLQAVTVW